MKKNLLLLIFCLASLVTIAQTKSDKDSSASKTIEDTTFTKVEVESEFPGGVGSWSNFLMHNLQYPNKAVRKRIQGEVVLQFIVCADGTVCNVEAVSGPEILRNAALEAFRKTPNWIPAIQDGKNVKSFKKQPIVFRLEVEKSKN